MKNWPTREECETIQRKDGYRTGHRRSGRRASRSKKRNAAEMKNWAELLEELRRQIEPEETEHSRRWWCCCYKVDVVIQIDPENFLRNLFLPMLSGSA